MKIICIGRNYHDHIRELKNEVPSEPVFFLKPDSAILPKKTPFFIPDFTKEVHYEAEIILRINRLGKHIDEKFARKYYDEIGLGIDFTARDLQQACKENGLPWEKAKAFDGSAVIGDFIPVSDIPDITRLDFSLQQNGETVQKGNTANMIFHFDKIIAYISQYFTLKIGDVIFTGTPQGVGAVAVDDLLEGYIGNRKMLSVKIK